VTVVLVHGLPETAQIWDPLRDALDRDAVALALPGYGVARPAGFSGTKDAYADWLARELTRIGGPIDLVGHDIGALFTMRVVTAFDVPVRSYAVDVADIFHPDHVWPDRVHQLQTPGVGEALLREVREADPADPSSQASRHARHGVPVDLARTIGAAHDETMSRSILDFYRSAVPNVAADWWRDVTGPTSARGLVFLLPDPPEVEQRTLAVARALGAQTASLGDLEHAWMAQAPEQVAEVLRRFWLA
jgi:pimeloyl-ACP methyl ester carboxylesterase